MLVFYHQLFRSLISDVYEKGKCISHEGGEVRIYGFAVRVKKTCEAEIEHAWHGIAKWVSIEGLCDYTTEILVVTKNKTKQNKKIVITTVVYSISAWELTQLVTKLQGATRFYVRNELASVNVSAIGVLFEPKIGREQNLQSFHLFPLAP